MKKGKIMPGIRLSLSLYWEESRKILIMCGIAVIMRVAQPFLGILMPKVVLDLIAAGAEARHFIITVGSLALALVVVAYIRALADNVANDSVGTVGIGKVMRMQLGKWATMDYQNMEDQDFRAADKKARKAINSNHAPAMNIPRTLVELVSNALGFVLYALAISSVHPVIMVVLLACSAASWFALLRARKYDEKTREHRSKLWGRLSALNEKLRDSAAAKDLRLYSALDWIKGVYSAQRDAGIKAEREVLTRQLRAQLIDALLILLRDGAAYAVLIWFVIDGRIGLGTFVYVFAAIGAMAGWMTGVLKATSDLYKACIEMGDIREMLEFPDRMNTGVGIALPSGGGLPPSIELKNVSFTYPKAEKPTLDNVSVSVRAGERIAIVGANGAGKSTLVKLLCGLYMPDKGEVTLNGRTVMEYNRDEYYTLFSTVFQEIFFTANSIAENISQQTADNTDMARVRRCLELTDFAGKVDSLPQKENTMLVRSVNEDAIELSGGEKQKLAMARAVYKDAPVVILDEPTAALDPIAENEVYNKYAELTQGKTSVFISHRLASTRFCDRILLINDGVIAEQGSHDELMALGGIYANMFEIQASYYKENPQNGLEAAI